MGELPIEGDQSVGLELGQSDVLGVKGVGPSELAGDLPCDILKDAVSEQPNPQPAHVVESSAGILLVISPRCAAWWRSESICERRSVGARM